MGLPVGAFEGVAVSKVGLPVGDIEGEGLGDKELGEWLGLADGLIEGDTVGGSVHTPQRMGQSFSFLSSVQNESTTS